MKFFWRGAGNLLLYEFPIRIDNINRCDSLPVPVIATRGIVNAAHYLYNDAFSSNSLLAVFGANLATPSSASGFRSQYGSFVRATPNQLLIQGLSFPNVAEPFAGSYSLTWIWPGIRWFDSNQLTIRLATPALFTSSANGSGQAAALNQDGTVNSDSNPALPGTVIQLFGTGFGEITEPVRAGETFSSTALSPLRNPASIGARAGARQVVNGG